MIIESRFMFKVLFSAAALMHVSFLIMFYNAGTTPMVAFNICSVLLYIGGVVMAFAIPSFEKHNLSATIIVYIEVSTHAVLATLLLGFEPCYLLYAISILPMCAFTLFSVNKKTYFRCMIIMSLLSTALIFATLVIDNRVNIMTGYELTERQIYIMRVVNIICNLILVFGFSFLFVNQMNHLLQKLSDSNEQLNYTATHDALTGLLNRHSLRKYLSALHSAPGEFCVCMGDIDNFKRTNDTFGHDCGDQVLKKVAEVIKTNMGKADMVCRWGGEEILMIMNGSRDECLSRTEKIRREIAELNHQHEGQTVPTTMTFGFARDAENPSPDDIYIEALISLADKRLYTGKNSGKNVIISE
ncbi:MAG: GGDEF domain-containing protein [Oscillospiraceae bacterium]